MGGRGSSFGSGGAIEKIKRPSTKQDYIKKLEAIARTAQGNSETYLYSVKVKEWSKEFEQKDGTKKKYSRTYFSIEERRTVSKHYAAYDYGYYDNKTNEYYATNGKKAFNLYDTDVTPKYYEEIKYK